MGTRSLTYVYNKSEPEIPVLCMYRQFDGYIAGHGHELAQFLAPITILNGFGRHRAGEYANGAGCLAAQLVKNFKQDIGGIYLRPHVMTPGDAGEEYTYRVYVSEGEPIRITVESVHSAPRMIFQGTPQDLLAFAEKESEVADA